MTNYEWLIKNKPELVKDILSSHVSKVDDIPSSCRTTRCDNCDFGRNECFCTADTKKWLEAEREPLWKKGDIVINHFHQIKIIAEDYYDGDFINITHYDNYAESIRVPAIGIKKKVGHLEETDDPSLCASCKSKECILQTGIVREHCDFYKAE